MSTAKSANRICITGMGMVSSLGRDVYNVCAAARAGLTRATELKCLNFQMGAEFGKETLEGFPPVMGHVVPGMGGFVGMARLILLGSAALEDLLANRPLSDEELDHTSVHINLSDQFIEAAFAAWFAEGSIDKKPEVVSHPSQRWVEETSGLIPKILARCGISISLGNQALYHGGHAGIVHAVQDAVTKIEKGAVVRCLVGGIESCVEPRFLQAAAVMGTLKTNNNPVGFMPGEAAGFFLLERISDVRKAGLSTRGAITGIAIAQDNNNQFSNDPPIGKALEQAIREAIAKGMVARESVALVIGDLNGNERRAMDWGYALVRLHNDYHIGDLPLWLPAISFGETGAATGALAVCLTVRGFERGYAPGDSALVWLASDNGNRGAIVLQSAQL
jgi:3-oxoacyl-[acyl-carrier-protein] synthase-1